MRESLVLLATLTLLLVGSCKLGPETEKEDASSQKPKPNIVLILADDMGYGDPASFNPSSQIPTPNLDRLASEGMRFTDAHAPAAVCVPSRYGLLTGRFPFRAALEWRERSVIEANRLTIASLLRAEGYATHMVGKWHQGFEGGPDYDYTNPLQGGPLDHGFDSYFGIPHSLDIPPYFYIRDREVVEPPTESIEASSSEGWSPIQGAFWRAGAVAPNFKHSEVLPRFGEEAVSVIRRHAGSDSSKPMFLYLALPAPHTPWLPSAEFQGKGGAGMYGEFTAQVDALVGDILGALDDGDMTSDTLLIFTSDNGPVWYDHDVDRFGHDSAGGLRGMKADAWEAGHRVPFIVRWPGQVPAGQESRYLITFTDFLATFASLVGRDLTEDETADSWNILPAFLDKNKERPVDQAIIFKGNGTVIRKGPWKLITYLGSGGFSEPRRVTPEPDGPQGQLYNLEEDLSESDNLWLERPEVVEELTELLEQMNED